MNDALVDSVLLRLGVATPKVTRVGAEALFAAWCLAVPFDNVLKRLALANGAPLPGTSASSFFTRWLETGAGGTCWATSGALHDLYRALGFTARRASACMGGGAEPTHGTVIVEVDGERLLADASMLGGTLLPLRADVTHAGTDLVPLSATPDGGTRLVTFARGHVSELMPCRLLELDVDAAFFAAAHEASRTVSGFNASLFARRNLATSIVVLKGDRRYVRTATGVEESAISDVARALEDDIGIAL